jgi:hypothetical protein
MRNRYWILAGRKPIEATLMELGRFLEHSPDRSVAQTKIGNVDVSTVFLGIDHNWFGNGPPLLFETMVFGGPEDGHLMRCSTWAEAEQQHERVCALVRAGKVKQEQENGEAKG